MPASCSHLCKDVRHEMVDRPPVACRHNVGAVWRRINLHGEAPGTNGHPGTIHPACARPVGRDARAVGVWGGRQWCGLWHRSLSASLRRWSQRGSLAVRPSWLLQPNRSASIAMEQGEPFDPLILPATANLSPAALERVRSQSNGPCATCKNHRWRLSKWQRGNGRAVDIQCVECGRSGRQPFPKGEHPNWQDYPLYDRDLPKQWDAACSESYRRKKEARSADYSEWLATSPAWAAVRKRVLARANNICEACLECKATVVHHCSYANGKLPPAWLLAAVCKTCHDRLHTPGDEWGPPIPIDSVGCDAGLSVGDLDEGMLFE